MSNKYLNIIWINNDIDTLSINLLLLWNLIRDGKTHSLPVTFVVIARCSYEIYRKSLEYEKMIEEHLFEIIAKGG
jgi:hypothetical protein